MKMLEYIYIQQVIVPDYRMGFFLLLKERYDKKLKIYAGKFDFDGSPESSKDAFLYFNKVKNKYFLNYNLLWQHKILRKFVRADIVILNANMRIISNLLILLLRKILGKKTILWGHIQGKNKRISWLRKLYFKLSDHFFTYSYTDLINFRKIVKNENSSSVLPNGCVYFKDCKTQFPHQSKLKYVIYSGRLIKNKKVDQLVSAFCEAIIDKKIPDHIKLIIFGDGPEIGKINDIISMYNLKKSVKILGFEYDIRILNDYYKNAFCSVSPGYVGLACIQSFSFGVPMLISKNEFHSPEIEVCKNNENSLFFETNSISDLSNKLQQLIIDCDFWYSKRASISKDIAQKYTFECMVSSFISTIEKIKNHD